MANLLNADLNKTFITQSSPSKYAESKTISNPKTWERYSLSRVSLLKYDYKIIISILADRLKKIISKYIYEDQGGFIPRRSVTTTVRKCTTLKHHVKKKNRKALLLLFLDTKKVFDSVKHKFIFKTHETFCCGEQSNALLKIIYSTFLAHLFGTHLGHAVRIISYKPRSETRMLSVESV